MSKLTGKILIIQGGYSNSGVGEQFTESMISGYPKECIHRFSIITSDNSLSKNEHGYPTTTFRTTFSAIPILSTFHYWKFKKTDLERCFNAIMTLIKEEKIELIWMILNGLHTIQLTGRLVEHTELPMVAHIWDVPEYKADQCRLDPYSKQNLITVFKRVMLRSKYAITVSDSMGRIYHDRYGIESSTMVFCPPEKALLTPNVYNQSSKEINIIFAGSMYAHVEWNAFLNAVEKHNSSDSDLKINVTCVGPVSRKAKARSFVKYEKLKPVDEAAKAINKADIAYLPYWMDKKYEYAVQTAFPSKLSLYVASGTPVLYHGPSVSTPAEFLLENKVGISCHSLDSDDIIKTILKILNEDFQSQYKTNQKRTLQSVFHPERSQEIFIDTIQEII